jgi:GAF domain-containing protein
LAEDERFPRFAMGAVEFGVSSVLSLPLMAGDKVVGSLNMYSQQTGAFDETTEQQLAVVLDYLGHAIGSSRLFALAEDVVAEAVIALEDRSLIARAVGVLMYRHERTPSQAFDLLEERALVRQESTRDAAERVLGDVRSEGQDPG